MKVPDAVYVAPTFSVAFGTVPTTGATLVTLTAKVAESVRPSLSVTVTRTVNAPSCAKVCETDAPLPVLPSPKSQA